MRISTNLSALALRQLIGGACSAIGFSPGESAIEGVVGFLTRHFTDHSQRLGEALRLTNDRAWKALEVALAGESLWDRCKLMLASTEDKAFREQVRPFLDACPMAEMQGKAAYRQACLDELRTARKAGLLAEGKLEPAALARQAGAFARFANPQALLDAEAESLLQMSDELHKAGHANLAGFVGLRPQRGDPLLVLAARYFFRRAVETDSALFQGLAFAQLEQLQQAQEAGFTALQGALTQHADRLERVLDEVRVVVVETHAAVLDVRAEQQRQSEQARDIYQAVLDMQHKLDLMNREIQPRDSLSIRSDGERSLVKALVARYRGLSEEERGRMPALLNAIGQLEVAAGDFQAARSDFAAVAGMVGDPKAQAEAHANAYRAALEKRDWESALAELREAARLDGARFAPFPMDKYRPERILGAGGFGVAFLCQHRFLKAPVVVKTLSDEGLDRGIDEVFAEAQALRQIDHPAIIRLQDCGFASPDGAARPYLVMDYFEGTTLEEQARQQALSVEDLRSVAGQIAAGLQAAHARGILHRDVKPANVLVRRQPRPASQEGTYERYGRATDNILVRSPHPAPSGGEWQVKLIDFGLALRRTGRETMLATSTTLVGSSIAGTLDYAAPEQMGKLAGVPVSPSSDVYGFARTCCYALFQTPQPLMRHWRSVPGELAELLERCLEELPEQRPQDFAAVLAQLAPPEAPKAPAPVAPALAPVNEGDPATAARRQELTVLAQQVSGCQRCATLCRTRSKTVFGVGPLNPDIMFIGEAPGADEDRTGEPFMGAAGGVFNELLATVGLQRPQVFITNLLKCRPPGNRKPEPAEVGNCREYLTKQIEIVRPRSLVALGASAGQGLLGTSEFIGRLRGRLHDYRGLPVLCTYHPAFLLPGRSPDKKKDVIGDLQMLLRRLGRR
jgi:uracil-DNA glycosylase family 4